MALHGSPLLSLFHFNLYSISNDDFVSHFKHWEDVMDRIQIMLALLTITMSGVVSGIVTFQLNARRDTRELRRQKLEALYESFDGFVAQLGSHWLTYMSVMANKIEYNTALDLTIKNGNAEVKHFRTLDMLTAIYFPKLQVHLDELHKVREMANDIMHQHKEEYRVRGPHKTEALTKMKEISKKLSLIEDDFRDAVRNEADKLNRKIPGGH